MRTYSFKTALRGKLVTVSAADSSLVFSEPESGFGTGEYIRGPATAGTATGKTWYDGRDTYLEVWRVETGFGFGVPTFGLIYMADSSVTLKTNPDYDPTKDTNLPGGDGKDVPKPDDKEPDPKKPDPKPMSQRSHYPIYVYPKKSTQRISI